MTITKSFIFLLGLSTFFLWLISSSQGRSAGQTIMFTFCLALLHLQNFFTKKEITSRDKNRFMIFILWILLLFLYGIFSKNGLNTIKELIFFYTISFCLLINENLFNIKKIDISISVIVCIGIITASYLLLTGKYNLAYVDRFEISFGRAGISWLMLWPSIYLSLKYSKTPNKLLLIGVTGTLILLLTSSLTAFRGRSILCILSLVFCFFLSISTSSFKRRLKSVSLLLAIFSISISIFIHNNEKFSKLITRYQQTLVTTKYGGLKDNLSLSMQNDGRVAEVLNNTHIFTSPKIIIGYGLGARWISNYSYGSEHNYIRNLFHSNLAHFFFKIGAIGFIIFAYSYYKKISRYKLKAEYLCFLTIWSLLFLYYGDKYANFASFINFFVLANPNLFYTEKK